MPLHDWSRLPEWDGVHQLWISELYYDIQAKLPAGYRAGLGTVPALTIGAAPTKPDIGVHESPGLPAGPQSTNPSSSSFAFDDEIDVLTLDPSTMVQVYRERDLVAILELISPRNKDRVTSRIATRDRIIGYLMLGIHVAYVDVHARPADFSLADSIAEVLEIRQPPLPAPHALAYRVGTPADKLGRSLSVGRTSFSIGQPLPQLGLPISREVTVPVELEATYLKVTRSYLSWLPSTNGASNC